MSILKEYTKFIAEYDKKDLADQVEYDEVRSAIFDDIIYFIKGYEDDYDFIVEVDEGSEKPDETDVNSLVVYTLFKPKNDVLWTKVGLKISEAGFEVQDAILGVHVEDDWDPEEVGVVGLSLADATDEYDV